jgi:membrane-associated phospholipid phosphatase
VFLASLLHELVHLDRFLLEASVSIRWEPLTVLFVIASAWWVKGPLIVVAGAVADRGRRRLPLTGICGATASVFAAVLSSLLKDLFDRARPALADPSLTALVSTPDSPSFPSGHAMTAFAAAAAVGVFHPRLRWPLYGLAALVGLSRIYLGVHFTLDVLVGSALGIGVGLAVAWAIRWRCCPTTSSPSSPAIETRRPAS